MKKVLLGIALALLLPATAILIIEAIWGVLFTINQIGWIGALAETTGRDMREVYLSGLLTMLVALLIIGAFIALDIISYRAFKKAETKKLTAFQIIMLLSGVILAGCIFLLADIRNSTIFNLLFFMLAPPHPIG